MASNFRNKAVELDDGFRFAPRMRDISELKLYSITKPSEYKKIDLSGKEKCLVR